jgi:nitrate reductase delta subunit
MNPSSGNDIFKVISILLQFPDQHFGGYVEQLQNAIQKFSSAAARSACNNFLAYLKATPLLRLQEIYTETFDLRAETCLNLTFHKCGNTQERGHALVKLNQLYNSAGLEIANTYLPDYLPLMLEFVYQHPIPGKNQLLNPYSGEIELLASRLEARGNPYACLIRLVCDLTSGSGCSGD